MGTLSGGHEQLGNFFHDRSKTQFKLDDYRALGIVNSGRTPLTGGLVWLLILGTFGDEATGHSEGPSIQEALFMLINQ
jgi:hypothetical protein